MSRALRASVSSLRVRNYRRWFAGQIVSVSGNWAQMVAEMWLILHLTGSGTAVGLTAAVQFAPLLFLGAFGGLLADRFDKRRLLMVTQAAMAVPALLLFTVTVTGVVEAWMVYALVLLRGTINSVDNPARQSFVFEIVGADRVVNAVGLNSVLVHASRIFGPAVAGLVITLWGVAPAFLINALSFGAMIVALRRMDPGALAAAKPVARERGALRQALRHVRRTPALRIPLGMMTVVGALSFNFLVLVPLLTRFTFGGGPSEYAALMSALAVGSVTGALVSGTRAEVTPRLLMGSAIAFGVLTFALAAAPTMMVALIAAVPLGAASVTFAAGVNSALQLAVAPEMRGRVMALYSMVFIGTTPIGAPLVGWIAEASSPRWALALGGVAAVTGGVGGWFAYRRADAGSGPAASSGARLRQDEPELVCQLPRTQAGRRLEAVQHRRSHPQGAQPVERDLLRVE